MMKEMIKAMAQAIVEEDGRPKATKALREHGDSKNESDYIMGYNLIDVFTYLSNNQIRKMVRDALDVAQYKCSHVKFNVSDKDIKDLIIGVRATAAPRTAARTFNNYGNCWELDHNGYIIRGDFMFSVVQVNGLMVGKIEMVLFDPTIMKSVTMEPEDMAQYVIKMTERVNYVQDWAIRNKKNLHLAPVPWDMDDLEDACECKKA